MSHSIYRSIYPEYGYDKEKFDSMYEFDFSEYLKSLKTSYRFCNTKFYKQYNLPLIKDIIKYHFPIKFNNLPVVGREKIPFSLGIYTKSKSILLRYCNTIIPLDPLDVCMHSTNITMVIFGFFNFWIFQFLHFFFLFCI